MVPTKRSFLRRTNWFASWQSRGVSVKARNFLTYSPRKPNQAYISAAAGRLRTYKLTQFLTDRRPALDSGWILCAVYWLISKQTVLCLLQKNGEDVMAWNLSGCWRTEGGIHQCLKR